MKTLVLRKWVTNENLEAVVVLLSEGYINGYVETPKEFYCKHWNNDIIQSIDVHGGITYAGNDLDFMSENKWYLGFDTAHALDARNPCMVLDKMYDLLDEDDIYRVKELMYLEIEFFDPNKTFRDENFVIEQCEELSKQLVKLAEKIKDKL